MNSIKGKIFVDTNVLVYLFSTNEPDKKRHIKALLKSFANKNPLVWSTQIMQEFYVVMTQKYQKNVKGVKDILREFHHFELVINDVDIIYNAIDLQMINDLSFWDSMVVSSAQHSNCSILLTEDLNHNQKISGVLIQNPFKLKL